MINDEDLQFFRNMNCLVTGGTGLIGRQVVDLLCGAGAHVRIASLDSLIVDDRAEHLKADLTVPSVCRQVVQDMDYVFHLAGIKGSIEVTKAKPASFLVPMLLFNTNTLEAARKAKVRGLVYTSSIGAYSSAEVFSENQDQSGPPMDMFPGWSKRIAEKQIEAYRIQYGLKSFSVVRPCNVYGPGDNFDPDNAMVIPTLMHRIRSGESPVIVWGDGSAVRDFAYSQDIAEGVLLAMRHGTGDHPFLNLGSGVGISIRQLVECLQEFLDFEPFFDTSKPSGFPRRVMDITLARKVIGYNPTTPLVVGLKSTWEWFLGHGDEFKRKKNYFTEAD